MGGGGTARWNFQPAWYIKEGVSYGDVQACRGQSPNICSTASGPQLRLVTPSDHGEPALDKLQFASNLDRARYSEATNSQELHIGSSRHPF